MTLLEFLANRTFRIPTYQRDYSWRDPQVDDLLNDIHEAVNDKIDHYLGTFVLSRSDDRSPFEIVDGQQRLTTLFLVVSTLLEQLPDSKQNEFAGLIRDKYTGDLKLHFGVNDEFAAKLLGFSPRPRSGDEPTDDDPLELTGGRRRLRDAYQLARTRAQSLREVDVLRWIEAIEKTEVIRVSARDASRAIRIFQTINDRGLALSAMDKTKALLIYYSNRYLDGELDETINGRFGKCFVAFDWVKELVRNEEYRVGHIYAAGFLEDELLRYHYLAYHYRGIVGGGEYKVSDRTVLDGFLKQTMLKLSRDPGKLKSFIGDYTCDLREFFGAFQELVERIKTIPRLYKLFVVLGFSARLYPLLIRLHQRGILEKAVFDGGPDLLKCLEICDMRVYKIRRSTAAADIGKLSGRSRIWEPRRISDELRWITRKLMPEYVLREKLTATRFGVEGPVHMLIEYDECHQGEPHTLEKLRQLVREKITREHILPSDPDSFDVTSYGFADKHEYWEHVDRLGNILPLTSRMNARCGNKSPQEKMAATELYRASCYVSARKLAVAERYGGAFHKDHLVERTERLASWVMERWCLWDRAPTSPID